MLELTEQSRLAKIVIFIYIRALNKDWLLIIMVSGEYTKCQVEHAVTKHIQGVNNIRYFAVKRKYTVFY